MSMTLNLGFGGMCLFVPESSGGSPTRMYVLMPYAPTHEFFLVYDQLAPQGGTSGQAVSERINRQAIDLTSVGSSPILTLPPPEVADLGKVGRSVPRSLLSDDFSTQKTVGRVTFAAGSAHVPSCARGARWYFAHAGDPLPIRVVWQIHAHDDKLDFQVPDTTDASGARLITLKPSKATNVLDVWFFNSPEAPETLPPRTNVDGLPKVGKEAKHFHAYFDLLGPGPKLPTYHGLDLDPLTPDCYTHQLITGLDVMCIAATAPLQPGL